MEQGRGRRQGGRSIKPQLSVSNVINLVIFNMNVQIEMVKPTTLRLMTKKEIYYS